MSKHDVLDNYHREKALCESVFEKQCAMRGAKPDWSDHRVYDQNGTRNTLVVLTPTGIQKLEGLE
jgi:hypothetical protein